MKTNLFLISFFILIANSIFASSEQPLKIVSSPQVDPWVKEVGLNNFMPIIARVYKNGILYQPTGSLLGVFKDNKCWGYGGLGNSPLGTNSVYNITMKYNSTPVPGFTYKVYNPTSGKIYDLVETVTFTHQVPVGEIAAPISLNVQFAITATSADLNKGTVSGSVGTFTSGQSVNVIATPATGYRFVNWTDGVGGIIMSTEADYAFTASESRNLIANFDIGSVTQINQVSDIKIEVFPNPASNFFQISLNSASLNFTTIGVYDLKGLLVKQFFNESFFGDKVFIVERDNNFTNGLYILKVKTDTTQSVQKIIFQ